MASGGISFAVSRHACPSHQYRPSADICGPPATVATATTAGWRCLDRRTTTVTTARTRTSRMAPPPIANGTAAAPRLTGPKRGEAFSGHWLGEIVEAGAAPHCRFAWVVATSQALAVFD